jgi:hypothetical protein
MPLYENTSTETISVTSRFTGQTETFAPGETKVINFYIDYNDSRFTQHLGTDSIEPILYSNTESTSSTYLEILVPMPIFSPYYRVKIIPGTEDISIVFNDPNNNNSCEIKTTEIYERVMIWDYAPSFFISTAAASSCKVILEEIFGIPGL